MADNLAMATAALLAEDGLIAQSLPEFSSRDAQRQMANLVCGALDQKQNLLVEAPAGAGKTLAYLLPAVISGKRLLVSTATRYLQDQLIRQDIPLLTQALGVVRKVAVLKGRSSYACPYYLDKHLRSDQLSERCRQQLLILRQRLMQSISGELEPLVAGLDVSIKRFASCSAQDCLDRQCPQYQHCPLKRGRGKLADAHIVVVNHAVLFSDLLHRQRGEQGLLPLPDAVVIDEAHRLLDFARDLVGESVTGIQLQSFCREAQRTLQVQAPAQRALRHWLHRLTGVLADLSRPEIAENYATAMASKQLVAQLLEAFEQLQPGLDRHASGSFELNELSIRCHHIVDSLSHIHRDPGLCWASLSGHTLYLRNISPDPVSRVNELKKQLDCSWIFTSATLSADDGLARLCAQEKQSSEHFHRLESPFDYQANARLYLPVACPEPGSEDYLPWLGRQLVLLAGSVSGRVLCLFTSHKGLADTVALLRAEGMGGLLVQGEADNATLIDGFKRQPNGWLLGTGSYWEGLDLSGAPLAVVVIDKLPFASPENPVVKLRSGYLSAAGLDSFNRFQLPDAVLRLRQGCGRLLRRVSDRGVIMLADSRIHRRAYGVQFLNSLPAMPILENLQQVRAFLQETD